MDPRRREQLDRARKRGANVSVLLGEGTAAPLVIELGHSETALVDAVDLALERFGVREVN